MAKSIFDGDKIAIPCPECGHETEHSFGRLKANNKFTCAGCGNTIEVENTATALDEISKALGDIPDFFGGKK